MRNFRNKDNLSANREGRNPQKRKQYEAFGAYRPLTADSQFELSSATAKIAHDMHKLLERKKADASEAYTIGRMAVTFVQHSHVRSVMRRGGLRQGLALGRQLEQIETSDLVLPFDDIDWVGANNRKLSLRLDRNSNAYGELEQVAEAVESVLCDGVAGPKLHVGVPDHVTILRYGNARDGRPLSLVQKNEIAEQAWVTLDDRAVTSVALGKLMIGHGYDKPL